MSQDPTYIIKITGDKFHHEQQIDSEQKSKIIAFLMFPESNLTLTTNQPTSAAIENVNPTPIIVPTISLREYLNEKGPKTIPQSITVFMLYLREHRKIEYVSRDTLRNMFAEAQEAIPLNLKRDIDAAMKNGWIAQHEGKYFITATGENIVNGQFTKSMSPIKKRRSTPGKRISLSVRQEVENIQPVTNEIYWKLSNREKVLWLLNVGKENSIDELNFKEVSRLAVKVGDDIPMKQITSFTIPSIRTGLLVSTLSKENIRMLRILQPGINYIKAKIHHGEVA